MAKTDLTITGTADWLTKDGEWVFDFKCKSDFGWRQVKDRPDPGEVQQVAAYGYCLGAKRWGLVYLRKRSKGDVPEVRVFVGDVTDEHANAVIAFWAVVDGHLKAGTLPERHYSQESIECQRFCRFTSQCWEG